jgi:alkylation response protein AidB-like acyl-CoA dehydrogenase
LRTNVPSPALPSAGSPEAFAAHVTWERQLHAAGYAAIRWPQEYGGMGADALTQAIFEEEYVRAGAPERVTVVGHNLMGPTLMSYGTDEQKRRWLPDILAARTIWAQGYSEPEAGSDLASLRTRAVLDGDDLVIDGQKIWSSYAPYADWASCWSAPTPRGRSRRGSPSWRWTSRRRASRYAPSPSPTATRGSPRSS